MSLFLGRTITRPLLRNHARVGLVRNFTNTKQYDGIVLNAYTDAGSITLPSTNAISATTRANILDQLAASRFSKQGDIRILYNIGGVKQVAVVGLGKKSGEDQAKVQDAVRTAAATGVRALQNQGAEYIGVDVSVDPHGASEGASLAQFTFDKLKVEKARRKEIVVGPFSESSVEDIAWQSGQIYGASQNLARMLMTSPANLMTPKLFSDEVAYLLAGLEKTDVLVHDEEWAARNNMNAFLSVSKGSQEPLRFLEIHYKGGKESDPTHALVGKGVTFDAGGISLKPSNNMALMKGDMGGAATVAGALYGIIKLGLPVNVVAVTPLCENMPSGDATKPGDVVKAMNGKSIEVLDTDAEGRLILADALYYVTSKYKPTSVIDLATLTGAMDVALGEVFAGVFTNSDDLWKKLDKAGQTVSDPFWRMPLNAGYLKEMRTSSVADLNNLGKGRSGGACSAAAFLKEFVAGLETPVEAPGPQDAAEVVETTGDSIAWAHIDIAGVMDSQSTHGYHIKGMSGRPTRALIEYIKNVSN
ncbi:hypothetical protein CLU79DRAFT_770196 [Phycomyces nitens]|nr:hypothetical protein CLU79DRAFT_770196 [Phycomyces nitens]